MGMYWGGGLAVIIFLHPESACCFAHLLSWCDSRVMFVVYRNLGTAIVQLEPLLDELHTMPQPLEKKYPLVLHSKNAAEKKRQLQSSLSSPEKKDDIVTHFKASTEELDVGQLSLAFGTAFAEWSSIGSLLE